MNGETEHCPCDMREAAETWRTLYGRVAFERDALKAMHDDMLSKWAEVQAELERLKHSLEEITKHIRDSEADP